jgi:hypothetical protein
VRRRSPSLRTAAHPADRRCGALDGRPHPPGQDILGCRIGIENASTYLSPPGAEMSEAAFISAVVAEADCLLHLDEQHLRQ